MTVEESVVRLEADDESAPGRLPGPGAVERVFRRHHDHYAETSGEIAYQQMQDEGKVVASVMLCKSGRA